MAICGRSDRLSLPVQTIDYYGKERGSFANGWDRRAIAHSVDLSVVVMLKYTDATIRLLLIDR
jgi:hypothetical protein